MLTFGSGSGPDGATVAVPIAIANPAGAFGIDLALSYPPQLHLANGGYSADVTEGSCSQANGFALEDNVIDSSGTVYASLYGNAVWAGAGGAVLDLNFHVDAGAMAGVYPLQFVASETTINEGTLQTTLVNGAFTVPIGVAITGVPAGNTSPEGVPLSLQDTLAGESGAVSRDWHVAAGNGQVIADGTGATFAFTPSGIGTYTVTDTVTDSAGNSGSATTVVSVTSAAPTVTWTSCATAANEGDTKLYTFTTSAPDAGDTFSLAGQGVTVTGGTASNIVFSPATGSGSFDVFFPSGGPAPGATATILVQVEDATTGLSGSASASVLVADVAPSVAFTSAPSSADEGDTDLYTFTVTDPGIYENLQRRVGHGDLWDREQRDDRFDSRDRHGQFRRHLSRGSP